QVYAMQFRIALTERLSIIAVKDGWIDMNPTLSAFDSSGFANVTAGAKYNLIRDPKNQTIVSAGATFEIPMGQGRVLQGEGDGDFNIFLTGGKQLGCDWHALSSIGLRVPANHTDGSQMAWISSHLDRRLTDNFYGFVESNWFHYVRGGAGDLFGGAATGFEGHDVFNLGAAGVTNGAFDGQDVVTFAFGGKYKFGDYNEFGVAYEIPLTENLNAAGGRDRVIESRLTADLILRY
ncbi:MAG: hypothetical protein N2C14_15060, partial [Planctomycetales bacterium]